MFEIFSGGLTNNTIYKDNILEFDINKQEWEYLCVSDMCMMTMKYPADAIGVSEVNFADYEPWCQTRSLKEIKPSLPETGKKEDDAGAWISKDI